MTGERERKNEDHVQLSNIMSLCVHPFSVDIIFFPSFGGFSGISVRVTFTASFDVAVRTVLVFVIVYQSIPFSNIAKSKKYCIGIFDKIMMIMESITILVDVTS